MTEFEMNQEFPSGSTSFQEQNTCVTDTCITRQNEPKTMNRVCHKVKFVKSNKD